MVDTDFLFGLNPLDIMHEATMQVLDRGDLTVPGSALLEYQLVLRARGRTPEEVRKVLLALRAILVGKGLGEGPGIDLPLLVLQCEIEREFGLSYFDSLMAASALLAGEEIVSSDEDFDRVAGLERISLRG